MLFSEQPIFPHNFRFFAVGPSTIIIIGRLSSLQFDVNSWLATFKPKLADINQLVQLIVQGLECWNKTEAALIQGVRLHTQYTTQTIE